MIAHKIAPASDSSAFEAVDMLRVAAVRLVLAALALLIVLVDRAEPNDLAWLTYTALGCYTLYAALVCGLELRSAGVLPFLHRTAHWIDVAWFSVLAALTGGPNSIFFFGFFFAILVASFRQGFRAGLQVTLVAALLFALIELLASAPGPLWEPNRVLRPIYLAVLGYLIAYWGRSEITLKRRLDLLRQVAVLSNPRLGVDQTVGTWLEQLRAYYDAASCALVTESLVDSAAPRYELRQARRAEPAGAPRPQQIPMELARRLLLVPTDVALTYQDRAAAWRRGARRPRLYALDVRTGAPATAAPDLAASLAATLDARSFATVPVQYHQQWRGRVYLVSDGPGAFDKADAELLLQVVQIVTPVLENIRLVDRLATDAADEERQRIARDLHDGVIQTYIGLQMGLTGVRARAASGADVTTDLDRLALLAVEGIENLRGYVGGLRGVRLPASSLPASVRRFAERFCTATGIEVRVEVDGDLRVNDRLAAEIFQMVAEGLSNVRRHTTAQEAVVGLARCGNRIVLRIEDVGRGEPPPPAFTPRTISERAAALGAQVQVVPRPDGGSAVTVEIPY